MIKSFISNIVAKHMSKKLNDMYIKEEDITELLKQIRITLLEADVNLLVVKDFIKNIRQKSVDQMVPQGMDPQQFILTIIKEELTKILGSQNVPLNYDRKPLKIMLVGLQGSGKTTTAGKIATYCKTKQNKKPLLVALDVYRPAAIDQLETLAKESNVDFFQKGTQTPVITAKEAMSLAAENNNDVIIFDTAGRLQTNKELMDELVNIRNAIHPDEILLVVDAMSGQDMINVAQQFNDTLNLSGFIITKLDSDARAGVALSLIHLLNVPVKLTGNGEKLGSLDIFYPERMADRIIGLGDIMTLAEKASDVIDEAQTKKSLTKMFSGKMDLEDLMLQVQQIKKMGSLGLIAKMIPAAQNLADSDLESAEERIRIWTILMNSMTLKERKNPILFKKQPSRKERVIKGSGRKPDEFNKLINQWEKFRKQMEDIGKELRKGKNPFLKFMK
ncbi:MAG: signal recognition particle protein [Mycoplasma sp.]|nr:signal recognition particle protein [Mycoplasma sp.]